MKTHHHLSQSTNTTRAQLRDSRGPKKVRGSRKSYKGLSFGIPRCNRKCGPVTHQGPFVPPEEWFESEEEVGDSYTIVRREPGEGYRHVVDPDDVRKRLAKLPEEFLEPLQYVCLSAMSRKKKRYPLYGMQWGPTLYLYPMEDGLDEYFVRPPTPAQLVEAKMYGGVWSQVESRLWRLEWTEKAIRDFYLNNVLVHELGHLLDDRNRNEADRERYAEWFAIEYGYKPSRAQMKKRSQRKVTRRHHSS